MDGLACRHVFPEWLAAKPTETEVFDFEEFFNAVMGTFATESRLFDSAKRRHLVRDESGVNTHHSRFQPLRGSPDPSDIATVEVAGETKFSVVGPLNGLLIGLKTE